MTYNPFLSEDKHYFGSYFNLAYNNIEEACSEFLSRFCNDKKEIKNIKDLENRFKSIFIENISIVDYERWVNALTSYFPVVEYLDKKYQEDGSLMSKENRIKHFINSFQSLICAIDKLRNYYTHYYHEPVSLDDDTFNILDEILLKTIIRIKKKFLKFDKTQELIRSTLQSEIDILMKEREKYLSSIDKYKNKEETLSGVYNSIFNNYLDKNNQLKNKIKTRNSDNQDLEMPMSKSGIVFLLSLFLNKKDVESLKKNIEGYKATVIEQDEISYYNNSLYYMCTHKIYSDLAYKGLKYRLKTSPMLDKATLMMQMLDELTKVPDAIYQNITPDLQKQFIKDYNEYYKDNEENQGSLENSKVIHPVIRKRYEDKFNYFALRFLDEYAEFPDLRFHIHLGNYVHHKTYKMIGNIQRERIIKEKINVFGRLNEVIEAKVEYHTKTENNDKYEWEIFPNPSYLFPKENIDGKTSNQNANKIGIYIEIKNPKSKEILKENLIENPKRNPEKITKNDIISTIISSNNKIYVGKPTAYMSLNDIHSVLYELLVNSTSGEKIRNEIKNTIEKQIIEISDDNLENAPNDTINYQKLEKDFKTLITKTKDLLQEHNQRIADYQKTQNNRNYPNKRGFVLYYKEKGQIAFWLANEIKQYMPATFKSTWKGYQHSELQRSLAYIDISKNELDTLLSGWNYEKSIPFHFNLKSNIEDLYLDYLNNKIAYLEGLMQNFQAFRESKSQFNKIVKQVFIFLNKKNYTLKSPQEKKKQILAHPIFLKRNFLNNMPQWFSYYKQYKEYQTFYDLKLNSLEKSQQRKVDKEIQKQKKNDVFTLLMIKKIFVELFPQNQQDFNLLSLYNGNDEEPFWETKLTLELLDKKLKIKDVKLKNIGKYRKYEKDQRVIRMTEYFDNRVWSISNTDGEKSVEMQLEKYEIVRSQKLLKEIQLLEKEIHHKVSNKEYLKDNGNYNFRSYIIQWIQLLGYNSEEFSTKNHDAMDKIKPNELKSETDRFVFALTYIRNKFAHNQFPSKYFFEYCNNEIRELKEGEYIAEYFLEIFKECKIRLENRKINCRNKYETTTFLNSKIIVKFAY
ncbi:MAG: type VI-B CRISPR-associated RNA-guided ribonuclease Cas13b, partial [Cruoricaptor ignavus]|nr:type VI-B CRISPR-associated RNA-guided ribonuclease Cas13b [Cruoricaptor ignavus]